MREEEAAYFILLLSKQRAGSKSLEALYDSQIRKIQEERNELKHRIKSSSELSPEEQTIYYSEWYYSALHMILRNEGKVDLTKISEALHVPYDKVLKAIEFFEKNEMIKIVNGKYEVQDVRLHIDEHSTWVSMHHRNWRQKSIQFLDQKKKEDFHFTMVTSISEETAARMKQLIMKVIEESEPLIKSSPDQVVYNLNIDFHKIF